MLGLKLNHVSKRGHWHVRQPSWNMRVNNRYFLRRSKVRRSKVGNIHGGHWFTNWHILEWMCSLGNSPLWIWNLLSSGDRYVSIYHFVLYSQLRLSNGIWMFYCVLYVIWNTYCFNVFYWTYGIRIVLLVFTWYVENVLSACICCRVLPTCAWSEMT